MRRHRLRGQDGAAMVELALVLPLVMGVLLAMFTGGTAYFQKIGMVDAVREGARYGASLKTDGTAGGLVTWRQNVKDRVVALSGGQLVPGDVCADLVTPTGTNMACGVTDPAGAAADPTVSVVPCLVPGSCLAPASLAKVSVLNKTAKIDFVLFTRDFPVTARATARYERDLL